MEKKTVSQLPSLEKFVVSQKLVSAGELVQVKAAMQDMNIAFGTALMLLKLVDEDRLARMLETHFSVRHLSEGNIPGLGKLKHLIPADKCKALQVFPLTTIEESGQKIVLLGMTDPLDISAIRKVETLTHCRVQPAFLTLKELQALYVRFYRTGLDIFPPEVTYYGEKEVKKRLSALDTMPEKVSPDKIEIRALISLLVEKGIITLEEFQREMTRRLTAKR